MSFQEKTTYAAKGKWRGILMHLGLPAEALRDKHGPCPLCGGQDRFRFDNKDGRGTYICNNCGAGDGMQLALGFTGRAFSEVAAEIDSILGNVKPDAPARPAMTEGERKKALIATWSEGAPICPGDLAHNYLAARGVDEVIYPKGRRGKGCISDGGSRNAPARIRPVHHYG